MTTYADQRAHDVAWMTADERNALDPFTIQHLATWCEHVVFDDEREAFTAYALDALADDPSLADLGWPALLNAFHDA